MKRKICCVYNSAALYRAGIFGLMDEAYDVDWFFAKELGDIKQLPASFFKCPHYVETRKLWNQLYWQRGIQRLLRNRKYDAWFVLGEITNVSIWMLALRKRLFYPKKKLYFWSHGMLRNRGFVRDAFTKLFFHLPDGVFVYGNYARDLMMKNGFDGNRLWAIHNSLDYDNQKRIRTELQPSRIYDNHFGQEGKTLFFIGRLTPVKQLDMLVDALAMLLQRDSSYRLVFVGDGQERGNLEQKVKVMGLSNRVWFYGACYDEKVNAELIYNADVCVAPGNVGLTAMHTMAFGTPVITHNDFGWQMPEFEAIVEVKTGMFFERGSVESMVETIERWFAEKGELRDEVRKDCIAEIEANWTPEYQIEVIKSVLDHE